MTNAQTGRGRCLAQLALIVSVFAPGCNHMPPECADPAVLDTLKSIEAENLQKHSDVKFDVERFEIDDPHTVSIDDKVMTRSCVVNVKYKISDGAQSMLKSLYSGPGYDPRAIQVLTWGRANEVAALGGINSQRISLAAPDSAVSYSVRNNEDRSKASSYIVEVSMLKMATEAICGLEEAASALAAERSAHGAEVENEGSPRQLSSEQPKAPDSPAGATGNTLEAPDRGPDNAAGGVESVGNGTSAPVLISKVDPEYSEEALKAKYSGSVYLSIMVNTDGKAEDIKVVKSLGMGLDEKAVEAVQKWRFKPGMNKGAPASVRAQVEVNFRLQAGLR